MFILLKSQNYGFIVGEFTLDEDRRLLRLDFWISFEFFLKNFFAKFELLNSACGLSASLYSSLISHLLKMLTDSVDSIRHNFSHICNVVLILNFYCSKDLSFGNLFCLQIILIK